MSSVATAAPSDPTGFPTYAKQLAKAPVAAVDWLGTIEAIFALLQTKFGTVDWGALLMIIAPDLITGNFSKMLADILANLGKIWHTNTPAPQDVEVELRKHPMFASVS